MMVKQIKSTTSNMLVLQYELFDPITNDFIDCCDLFLGSVVCLENFFNQRTLLYIPKFQSLAFTNKCNNRNSGKILLHCTTKDRNGNLTAAFMISSGRFLDETIPLENLVYNVKQRTTFINNST